MRHFQNKLLFKSKGESVQKTYRIPKMLEKHISLFSSRNNLTNTDVVIEALLQYFSNSIIGSFTDDLTQNFLNIQEAKNDNNKNEVRKLMFRQRRLELLRAELLENFEDNVERLLHGLREERELTP